MSKLNRAANRIQWLKLVNAYQQSDLSREQFCIEKNIKRSTFDYWIQKSGAQTDQANIAAPGFARLISSKQPTDEFRLHFKGVDVFVSAQVDLSVVKNLIMELTQ